MGCPRDWALRVLRFDGFEDVKDTKILERDVKDVEDVDRDVRDVADG